MFGNGATMNLFYIIALAAFLPIAGAAQTAEPKLFVPASEVILADLIWVKRPVVVFADSPNDPNFIRQIQLLERNPDDLAERDVLVITDTDPAAKSEIRQKLRPRGFALVLMDKDGQAKLRKPLPWDVREISHAIDKFPLRMQEELDLYPSGR
jgi:Domain of unknown function (DUF4174)